MDQGDMGAIALDQHRQLESQLHLELTNACRKYMSKLGIVSIIGLLDIVKQESIELERATNKSLKSEKPEFDFQERSEMDRL
jgi:hypothetical protein